MCGLGGDVRRDRYIFFLLGMPARPSDVFFVLSFLACAADPHHYSYTEHAEQWVQFSLILNQRSVEHGQFG